MFVVVSHLFIAPRMEKEGAKTRAKLVRQLEDLGFQNVCQNPLMYPFTWG